MTVYKANKIFWVGRILWVCMERANKRFFHFWPKKSALDKHFTIWAIVWQISIEVSLVIVTVFSFIRAVRKFSITDV